MTSATNDLYQPITVSDIAANALNRDPDRTVIILGDDEIITAGQLRDSISRYAQALNSLTPRSRRAALLSKNRPEVPGGVLCAQLRADRLDRAAPDGLDRGLPLCHRRRRDRPADLRRPVRTTRRRTQAARTGAASTSSPSASPAPAGRSRNWPRASNPARWSRPKSIPKRCRASPILAAPPASPRASSPLTAPR